MIELEADDALASAAHLASGNENVQKVAIWTPDKDLAQCVRDTRVVQIDGRRKTIRDAPGVREKFGVDPPLIPDLLALVGDAADGYPRTHIARSQGPGALLAYPATSPKRLSVASSRDREGVNCCMGKARSVELQSPIATGRVAVQVHPDKTL